MMTKRAVLCFTVWSVARTPEYRLSDVFSCVCLSLSLSVSRWIGWRESRKRHRLAPGRVGIGGEGGVELSRARGGRVCETSVRGKEVW